MLTFAAGRVDCFGCVCVPSRLKDKVLCVLQYLCTYVYVLQCYFTAIFYAVVRQIYLIHRL